MSRLLVIGASSGIGKALAVRAAGDGHGVVAVARRLDRLEALGRDVVAVAGDVTDPEACGDVVAETSAELGGLDWLVYAAGVAPLAPLVDTDAETWRAVLATNLVGAALVTRAAIPSLEGSGGRAAYLSMGHSGRPWPFLGAYSVSKAALEDLVRAWRVEHPAVGFTTVAVGPTATPMADAWDPELAGAAFSAWSRSGHLSSTATMSAEDVAGAILDALDGPILVEDLRLAPPELPQG